jgi:hypothetical protein
VISADLVKTCLFYFKMLANAGMVSNTFSLNLILNLNVMAKSQDKRKEDKKKPVKTLKEKRAEKREKKK